jgi:hypothetical protein
MRTDTNAKIKSVSSPRYLGTAEISFPWNELAHSYRSGSNANDIVSSRQHDRSDMSVGSASPLDSSPIVVLSASEGGARDKRPEDNDLNGLP